MATNRTPRVYLDSCYYIDTVKGQLSEALDPSRDRHIPYVEALLLAAHDGAVEIWASTLVIAECLRTQRGPHVSQRAQDLFEQLLQAGNPVKIQSVDVSVAERARDLFWKYGINCGGGADGIHVATAIELGCAELITTNRKRGPLNTAAASALEEHFSLRVIEAPDTNLIPPKYLPHPLFRS